jgi:hypothetical protein
MFIPKNIKHDHIVTVMNQIDRGRIIPPRRNIRNYYCSHNDHQYPVKLLISWGYEVLTGQEFPSNRFITYEAVQYLNYLGFNILQTHD